MKSTVGLKFFDFTSNALDAAAKLRSRQVRMTQLIWRKPNRPDPKNSDYEQEHGAIRTIDGMKLGQKIMAEFKKEREEKEEGDVMQALENRTLDQKMELEILDGLEDIRALNAKVSKMDPMDILDMVHFDISFLPFFLPSHYRESSSG